jgi:plastocyanin
VAEYDGDAIAVHITDDGVIPDAIVVPQGQKITWINDQTTPHMLESEELTDAEGGLLSTPAFFPGESTSFTISAAIAPGTYKYASVTTPAMQGIIIVEPRSDVIDEAALTASTVGPIPTPVTTSHATFVTNANDQLSQTIVAPPQEFSQSNAEVTVNQDALLPHNPYTGDGPEHPFDRDGNPVESSADVHGGAPLRDRYPPAQPETGANAWVILLASTALFAVIARRLLHF